VRAQHVYGDRWRIPIPAALVKSVAV